MITESEVLFVLFSKKNILKEERRRKEYHVRDS
jgi:hypothetical protein